MAGLSDILSVKDRLPAAIPAATPATVPPPSHPPKNAPTRQATVKNLPKRNFGGNKGEDSGLDHFSDNEIGTDNFISYFIKTVLNIIGKNRITPFFCYYWPSTGTFYYFLRRMV